MTRPATVARGRPLRAARSDGPTVPLISAPRWVSATWHASEGDGEADGFRAGDVACVAREGRCDGAGYAILEVRGLPPGRSRYTHRLLFGRITEETAEDLRVAGGRQIIWQWTPRRRRTR